MRFLAPIGPFVLGNLGKNRRVENEPHTPVGVSGFRGAYWTVVQELVVDAHAYLRWVLGQRLEMPRHTRTHRYKHTRRRLGA